MLRPDVFMALVDEARLQGLPVIAHVPLALNAGDVSDAGVRSFEHLRNIELACSRDAETLLAIRTRLLEDGTARIGMELRRDIHRLQRPLALASYDADRCSALLGRLARNRTYQTATLFLSTKEARRPDRVGRVRDTLRYVPDTDRADWEDWSTGIDGYSAEEASARQAHSEWLFSLVRQMRDAGVPLLAGTDVSNPWIVPGFSLHEELAILVQAGLTPAEALRTATWNPANYFDALDHPILAGRAFDTNDLGEDGSAVIVNTTFVKQLLGGRNPIGRRVRYRTQADGEPGPWYEIVGLVGSLGMHVLDPVDDEGMYHPLAPGEINPVRLAIHVGDDPESFTPRLRALASEVDPTAVIVDPIALDRVFEGDWYLVVGMVLGGAILVCILLALAASSIYAIMSFSVAQRTREIGIRTAMGARRWSIAVTVAKRAMMQLGVGVLLGMPIAWRLFSRQTDSTLIGLVVGIGPSVSVMIIVGLLACTGPTLRALRIMPTEALREGG